jgi:immune inhibitor A
VKKLTSGVLTGALAAALAASMTQAPASAAPPDDQTRGTERGQAAAHRPDNRPGPLTKKQDALRQAAVKAVLEGRARAVPQKGGGSVVELGESEDNEVKSAEFLDAKKNANVLSILSQFGDQVAGRYKGDPGPKANEIPMPDRDEDNSTTWFDRDADGTSDYDAEYYDELFNGSGESMKNFYLAASDGEYTVENTVEGWTTVPYNDAYYGANPREDEGGAWDFIQDTGNSWYSDKLAELGSAGAVDAYLAQFDQWDRYDQDGDGDYNEPDGYIDHFQAIHAGEGEEAGASPDAIWSHRWYVNGTDFGATGPTVDGEQVLMGGARIGQSQYWIGDYTVEPENGGLGVFVHEYGHDLGLPDFYDTSGGDNGVGFWTAMASGSWLGHGEKAGEGIGTTPNGFGPDEKLFLGWLDHETVDPGEDGEFTINPAAAADGSNEAVVVNLPDKVEPQFYVNPAQGEHAWWSGRGDDLSNTLTTSVPAANRVTVSASAWWEIEAGYDYLYAEYSLDDGATWKRIGQPIDGVSRGWENLRYGYRAAGQESLFRFRYQTDGGVNEPGAFLDTIVIKDGKNIVLEDDAEQETDSWDADGWSISTGTDDEPTAQYYLVENRQFVGYDRVLQTGPYNFSEGYSRPNWVEFFEFNPGMLVWFADKAYRDNNTKEHEGHGQSLPVDRFPAAFSWEDGTAPTNRRQGLDATFGLGPVESQCLHKEVNTGTADEPVIEQLEACSPADEDGEPTFSDEDPDAYWSADNPWNSTKVAGHGVEVTITGQVGNALTVQVTNPEAPTNP